MHVKPRSYLTAGIAALGVGALALAPVQPIPNQVALNPQRVVNGLGVDLASTIDPITPWVDTFEAAGANIATLFEFYLQKPFPLLQTIAANTATYAEEAANGQGNLIGEQIWNNIVTFFEAPWSPGTTLDLKAPPAVPDPVPIANGEYLSRTVPQGVDPNSPENLMNGLLVTVFVPEIFDPKCSEEGDCLFTEAAPILNFMNSHYSGQVLGFLGPLLAPIAVLTRSFTAIGEFFEAGDVAGAINELINIPANLVNGVLNGAGYLDLTEIITSLVDLPVESVGFNLGGLLSATPLNGSLIDPANPPTEYSGGMALDGLAAVVNSAFGTANFPGVTVGPIGSAIGLGQFLGDQLLVTPPPPTTAAAEPAAAKQAAPLEIPAPALTEAPAEESAPAVVDIPAEEAAPAVAEVVAEDPAPAVDDTAEVEAVETVAEVEAAVEAVEASAAEPTEVATPAAGDSGPEAAADSDKSEDDTDRSGSNNRRGAS